jgi:hypothetical protein
MTLKKGKPFCYGKLQINNYVVYRLMKIILNEFGCYFVLRFKYNKKENAFSLPYCYSVKLLVYYYERI